MATLMVDHYSILGLPSGEEGSKLTLQEISSAYRAKARQLHPDKRPDDPNAHADFQRLHLSYHILHDEKSRKVFDDELRALRGKQDRETQYDEKRRKMVSELKKRERPGFEWDPEEKERVRDETTKRKLMEELAFYRAKYSKARSRESSCSAEKPKEKPKEDRSNLVATEDHEELERLVLEKIRKKTGGIR